tara:strand:+ start:61 stop:504 length:444 start_codon:yes stop_codon:yes gene_type:complete
MSTRSEIAIENKDCSISSIYCHSDGYLEYNGKILNNHYNSYELALSIIKENDCSSLGETIEDSRFYNTWRAEDTKAKNFDSEYSFMFRFSNDIFAEYIYLFKNDRWYVSELKTIDNPQDNYINYIAYHTEFTPLDIALSNLPSEEIA